MAADKDSTACRQTPISVVLNSSHMACMTCTNFRDQQQVSATMPIVRYCQQLRRLPGGRKLAMSNATV